jgi:hypothetical protein
MRFIEVVLDSVLLCQQLRFLYRGEQFDVWPPAGFAYRNSSLDRLLNDSANGFFQGDPGSM